MKHEDFKEVLNYSIMKIREVLDSKDKEYSAEGDRLHNFKVAAALQGITPRQALAGMMAKHTASVYDMAMSTDKFTGMQWDEKIIDHLNYLILLRAVVCEESEEEFKND